MRPAFSNALYYPDIDIKNTNWLRTAILFWDSISTIVPESLTHPYNQPDTQYLADIGFLRPIYVNSNNKSVIGIEEDILDLLLSPEFIQVICSRQAHRYDGIWNDKLSYKVRDYIVDFLDSSIYSEKMSWRLREEIQHFGYFLDKKGRYYFDKEFAYIYMIILANKLCEDYSLGMITDNFPCFNIGNTVKYGSQPTIQPEDYFRNKRPKDHQLEQGILLNFIINGISISPDSTIADIISFKNKHQDELRRFRTQLSKLTKDLDGYKSIDVMKEEISDLYNNEFIPSFNELKAALTDSRIQWFTNTFFKVSLLSASTTGIPMAILGMPIEQALFASMGISVIASSISYNVEKKQVLRNNPYSYLLSINRELI